MPQAADEYKVFSAKTLTATITDTVSDSIEIRSDTSFTFLPVYAMGAAETGNNVELEIAFSPDGTNWCINGVWIDPGTGQLTERQYFYNVTELNLPITITNITGRWMRIRAKEEGVATNAGTLSLYLYRTND